MDKQFHPTLDWVSDYSSTLRLKLIPTFLELPASYIVFPPESAASRLEWNVVIM